MNDNFNDLNGLIVDICFIIVGIFATMYLNVLGFLGTLALWKFVRSRLVY